MVSIKSICESKLQANKSKRGVSIDPPVSDRITNSSDPLLTDSTKISMDKEINCTKEAYDQNKDEKLLAANYWNKKIVQKFTSKSNALTILLLFYCNLINYMDRSTVAGMISFIKDDKDFNVHSDKSLGLLQTVFVVFYMITAPVFGYLGDRYSRKWILAFGLCVWSLSTLIGSLQRNFLLFIVFRALVGIGEASYSTIAPAMIADLFKSDSRSNVLALFYFAIPVGTGLGYIVGSEVAGSVQDWRWGLRVTPIMGLLAIVSIIALLVDSPRGSIEGSRMKAERSPLEELKGLARNKSFIVLTMAFTCVAFCVGALMWWGPTFAYYGSKARCGDEDGCDSITPEEIAYKFGIAMTFAGLLGVPLGSFVARKARHHIPNADPIVCGVSLLISVPVLFIGFIAARYSVEWCYGLTFLAGLLLNCNWAIVSDITLYIVIPTRRSFASATQILISHAFGDAISPYLIGTIADFVKDMEWQNTLSNDAVRNNLINDNQTSSSIIYHSSEWFDTEFTSLQYALFLCCLFQIFAGILFLMTSKFVLEDKANADKEILGKQDQSIEDTEAENTIDGNHDKFEAFDDRMPIVRKR